MSRSFCTMYSVFTTTNIVLCDLGGAFDCLAANTSCGEYSCLVVILFYSFPFSSLSYSFILLIVSICTSLELWANIIRSVWKIRLAVLLMSKVPGRNDIAELHKAPETRLRLQSSVLLCSVIVNKALTV